MFGRRKHEEEQGVAREVERKALLAELAKRPDTVCPFLGLAASRTEYHPEFTREHRCFAFGDPSELSADQQERICLQRGYGNCPRYLRGVLVIPTEELEALRRPVPAPAPQPAPSAPAAGAPAAQSGGRRRGVLIGALVLLLALGGGGAAFVLLGNNGTAVGPSPTPQPTLSEAPSVSSSASAEPSQPPPTETPDPTPIPGDVFTHYEVGVAAGEYTLYEVDDATGEIIASRLATFSRNSQAPVEKLELADGRPYWRTLLGELTGFSYVYPDSGDFVIRAVYRRPDGSRSSELLPESEL
jgi:hypothetical protein